MSAISVAGIPQLLSSMFILFVSILGVVSMRCSGTHIICLSSSWLAWHYINISELLVLYMYAIFSLV